MSPIPTGGRVQPVPKRLDPIERVRRADDQWKRARERTEAASEARKQAIIDAHEAGASVYDIAGALGISHEGVRRVLVRDGARLPYRRRTA